MRRALIWFVFLLSVPCLLAAAPAAHVALVACAPGYPGTTAEAQGAMNELASVLADTAHWDTGSTSAVYFPKEAEGLKRIEQPDAAIALVPLPFYMAHHQGLGLKARLSVETKGAGLTEQWTLVAKKGRIKSPSDLAGMTIQSIAGYAPQFVRAALSGYGKLPETTKIAASTQVLSSLRKAAKGPDIAVLLDGEQAASLDSLPFAKDLEVVTRSQPMPTALVATVDKRMTEKRWKEAQKALLAMSSAKKGTEALSTIRMVRFAPLDEKALSNATSAWAKANP